MDVVSQRTELYNQFIPFVFNVFGQVIEGSCVEYFIYRCLEEYELKERALCLTAFRKVVMFPQVNFYFATTKILGS